MVMGKVNLRLLAEGLVWAGIYIYIYIFVKNCVVTKLSKISESPTCRCFCSRLATLKAEYALTRAILKLIDKIREREVEREYSSTILSVSFEKIFGL